MQCFFSAVVVVLVYLLSGSRITFLYNLRHIHTCFSTSVCIHECIHSLAKLTMNICKGFFSLENFAYVELMNLCEYIFEICFATFESSATSICTHNVLKLPKADYIY